MSELESCPTCGALPCDWAAGGVGTIPGGADAGSSHEQAVGNGNGTSQNTSPPQPGEVERLRSAMQEIRDLKPTEYEFPADWSEQIAACEECQRYKGHPIQQGICDQHRRPIWARESHASSEEKRIGWRAISIARAALTPSESGEAIRPKAGGVEAQGDDKKFGDGTPDGFFITFADGSTSFEFTEEDRDEALADALPGAKWDAVYKLAAAPEPLRVAEPVSDPYKLARQVREGLAGEPCIYETEVAAQIMALPKAYQDAIRFVSSDEFGALIEPSDAQSVRPDGGEG